jgi:hypothetical protein
VVDNLDLGVNRCRCGVTLGYAGPLKKVDGILSLGQAEAVRGLSDGDAEEVV